MVASGAPVVAAGMGSTIEWPKKMRELHNHHFDSTIWNDLRFRDDDIVIATYAKSGTTWIMWSAPARAASASGRRSPWVSEITPTVHVFGIGLTLPRTLT